MISRHFSPSWRVLLGVGALALAAVAVTWRVFAQAQPLQTPSPTTTRTGAIDVVTTGAYPDGAMFLLSFYDSEQKVSTNRTGFVQADLDSFELHLIDRRRPGEGHYFDPFAVADKEAGALPAGNACIRCHLQDGAYRGTFAQFYPTIRHRIPKRALTGARAPLLRPWI